MSPTWAGAAIAGVIVAFAFGGIPIILVAAGLAVFAWLLRRTA